MLDFSAFKISTKLLNLSVKKLRFLIVLIFILLAFFLNLFINREQQFWYMADSLMQGKLYVIHMPGNYWFDFAFYKGHFYWPLGPFPGIVMIPFVFLSKALGIFINQGVSQFLATLGIIFLCFKLARIYKFSKEHSLFLGFAFCFSSVYIMSAYLPWGWYFSQAIVVVLIFASLYEYLTKKRYWLIGFLFGLVLATRFTAGVGIIFFIADIVFRKTQLGTKKKALFQLLIPFLIIGVVLLLYNQARFGSLFDSGYLKVNNTLLSKQDRFEELNYGLFQLRNIPSNFYYYFIKSLDPVTISVTSFKHNSYVLKFPFVTVNYPGTSFFIVSPIFLLLLKTKFKDRIVKLSFATVLIILLIVLSWYWPGWRQVGPRYMLDFLPFAFIPLLLSFENRKLPIKAQALIFASAFFNFYLLASVLGK